MRSLFLIFEFVMMRRPFAFPVFILFLMGAALACVVPGIGSNEPAPSPTPLGDTLSFVIPVYTRQLEPGDTVPGTRLHYVGRSGDAHQVTIDGLEATKRVGDSFIWHGVLAPGVYANYNLRLATAVLGALSVAGPVEIIVFNPEPSETSLTPEITGAPIYYDNILVNDLIPPGRLIPGTTLIYEGITTQGEGQQASQMARLSGLSGYPLLALGDSLVWTGQLRDNVYIRYNLRVTAMNEDGLRLSGKAELWIPSQEQ
jgi:hypothetical protein